jgi:hypothetical protein
MNNDTQTGLRLRLKDFGPRGLASSAITLAEELFISSATLSEYVREAERANSIATKAGEMVDIDSELATVDMEFDVDTSSQESTLPNEVNEDDERRYQREEERDEKERKVLLAW